MSEGARLVASPAGHMDADGGERFAAAVHDRLAPDTASVTVDLAGLDQISLGGVRALLRLGRSLKSSRCELAFIHGDPAVRHAFEHAGFDDFFSFTPALHNHRGHHDEAP